MYRYMNASLCDVTETVLNVYATPTIAALRNDINDEAYCVNHNITENLTIQYEAPLAPSIKLNVSFGDGSYKTYNYNDIISQNINYKYKESSCGKDAIINNIDTICEDCYIIMLLAKNTCSENIPSLSFASPVPVKIASKPQVSFNFDADESIVYDNFKYHTCLEDIVIDNNTQLGIGGNCLAGTDTVLWQFKNLETNVFLPETQMYCDTSEANHCDTLFNYTFPDKGKYRLYLSQENSCGIAIDSAVINIRNNPDISFKIDNFYDCYPADITFINTSTPELIEANWIFIKNNTDTTRVEKIVSSDVTSLDISELYLDEGDFRVIMEGKDKYCENEIDTIFSFDKLCEDLYVPNAFIPTSPTIELKTFKAVAINLIKYKMEIFDLHGKLLWETDKLENGEPAEGWDGTFQKETCPQGTYIWKITATLDDGYTEDGVPWKGQKIDSTKKRTVGTISLIR